MNVASPVKPSLSVAILGAGKIGSTFAYQLASAGHSVTVIARPDSTRLWQLRRDNGIVLKTRARADVHVVDALDEQAAFDLVIVTILSHQVDALLPIFFRSQAKCFHFMFNNFEPERLASALGEKRCAFGMPFVMATIDDQGRLNPTISKCRKTLHSDQRWVDLFESASIPSKLEPNMRLWLRSHVPVCVALESIAVMGQKRGGGASWPEANAVAQALHGGFAIISGLGYTIYPRSKSRLASFPRFVIAAMLWTFSRIKFMRELLATGVDECRRLIDTMVSAAEGKPELSNAVKALLAVRRII